MNDLDESIIRFCLLHEEGHIRLWYYMGIYPIVAIYLIWLILHGIEIIFLIIAAVLGIIFCRQLQLLEEYRSDEFASNELKQKYSVSKPSEILESALKMYPITQGIYGIPLTGIE